MVPSCKYFKQKMQMQKWQKQPNKHPSHPRHKTKIPIPKPLTLIQLCKWGIIKPQEIHNTSYLYKHAFEVCLQVLFYNWETYYILYLLHHAYKSHRDSGGGKSSCPYKYAALDSNTSQNRSVTKMFACLARPSKKGQRVTEPGKVIKLNKSRQCQCAICEGILLRTTN